MNSILLKLVLDLWRKNLLSAEAVPTEEVVMEG